MEYIEFFNHIYQEPILKDYIFKNLLAKQKRVKKGEKVIISNDEVVYISNPCFLRKIHLGEKAYYNLLSEDSFVFTTKSHSKMVLIALMDTEYSKLNKNALFNLLESENILSCFYLAYAKKIQEDIRFDLKMSGEDSEGKVLMLLDKLLGRQRGDSAIPNSLSIYNIAKIVSSSVEEIEEAIQGLKAKGYIQGKGRKLTYHAKKSIGEEVVTID
ncbi:Crp/Fnr family transcriptional regulator [Listeria innocua]|uniref:Crp/Fnr family transcriptional regulator n=1 Tax=Listeria innocua TaxID=1642 RepID=UPI001626147D|nr:Crp/Fnr family transcriptional regulator [Listeria innocua]MBC1339643.1 Crp/Fnr family transcriptional regulator [Listeria innocua]MBC1353851.1 Crp/Fnr family transcriptional regulator [Listeria innocua]